MPAFVNDVDTFGPAECLGSAGDLDRASWRTGHEVCPLPEAERFKLVDGLNERAVIGANIATTSPSWLGSGGT
ncbi:MAG: hypothetical protein ABSA02_19085 [Trebonia sp.]